LIDKTDAVQYRFIGEVHGEHARPVTLKSRYKYYYVRSVERHLTNNRNE